MFLSQASICTIDVHADPSLHDQLNTNDADMEKALPSCDGSKYGLETKCMYSDWTQGRIQDLKLGGVKLRVTRNIIDQRRVSAGRRACATQGGV